MYRVKQSINVNKKQQLKIYDIVYNDVVEKERNIKKYFNKFRYFIILDNKI